MDKDKTQPRTLVHRYGIAFPSPGYVFDVNLANNTPHFHPDTYVTAFRPLTLEHQGGVIYLYAEIEIRDALPHAIEVAGYRPTRTFRWSMTGGEVFIFSTYIGTVFLNDWDQAHLYQVDQK